MSDNPIKKLIEEVDADTTLTDEAREATKARLSRLNDAHKSEMEKVKSAKQAELERKLEELKSTQQTTPTDDTTLYKTQLSEMQKQLEEMRNERQREKVGGELISAITKHNFIDNDLVKDAVKAKLVYSGDGAVVKDSDGETYTIEAYISKLATRAALIKAGGIPGDGGSNGVGGGKQNSSLWSKPLAQLSESEKIQLMKEDGKRYREKVVSKK